jgi:hypothetical protein
MLSLNVSDDSVLQNIRDYYSRHHHLLGVLKGGASEKGPIFII